MTTADWERRKDCDGLPPEMAEAFTNTFELGDDWRLHRRAGTNHRGDQAKAVCRTCPVRHDCLTDAIETNYPIGIRGGAGGADRRYLRRMWLQGPDVFRAAVRNFFAGLDGDPSYVPPDRNGEGAQHCRASTQAKGCDCDGCSFAAGQRNSLARVRNGNRPTPNRQDQAA